jgi:hypothetical protein
LMKVNSVDAFKILNEETRRKKEVEDLSSKKTTTTLPLKGGGESKKGGEATEVGTCRCMSCGLMLKTLSDASNHSCSVSNEVFVRNDMQASRGDSLSSPKIGERVLCFLPDLFLFAKNGLEVDEVDHSCHGCENENKAQVGDRSAAAACGCRGGVCSCGGGKLTAKSLQKMATLASKDGNIEDSLLFEKAGLKAGGHSAVKNDKSSLENHGELQQELQREEEEEEDVNKLTGELQWSGRWCLAHVVGFHTADESKQLRGDAEMFLELMTTTFLK